MLTASAVLCLSDIVWAFRDLLPMILLFLAISLTAGPAVARPVRGRLLSIRQRAFAEAALCVGIGIAPPTPGRASLSPATSASSE